MGWHIHAYYDINQDDFSEFLTEHNLHKEKWEDADEIAKLYREKCLLLDESVYLIYYWNSNCGIHELYEIYGVNFIRNDERFTNPRFHRELEKRMNKPFPSCLLNICWDLRTREDALQIAEALKTFFLEDEGLTYFAKWLTKTARYCSTYDISY